MDESTSLPIRLRTVLEERGLLCSVRVLAEPGRTAAEASRAIGCKMGQIAKSLVFRACVTDSVVIVIASGCNRVDECRVGELVGEQIVRPDADFVRRRTGYVIGGVPPFGHLCSSRVILDEDLMQFAEVWASGGNPKLVLRLTPGEIQDITQAIVSPISGHSK